MWNLRRKNDVVARTVAPAVEFFRKISPKDKVVVVNDDDCDGICSGTILNIILRVTCKNKPVQIPTKWHMVSSRKFVRKILAYRPKYVIIIDVPDIDIEVLGKLGKTAKVLIIDHHTVKRYKNVVYSNPRLFDADTYLPATYLAYKISERMKTKNKKIIWIAAAGVLGDFGVENCGDLFTRLKKDFLDLVGDSEIGSEKLLGNSKLGLLVKILDGGRVVNADAGAAFAEKILLEAKNYNEILEGKTAAAKKLLGWYEIVKKEFEKLVGDFKEESVSIGNVLFFEFESELNLKSPLANAAVNFYEDKIIVVAQKDGKHLSLSMRRGKNVNTNLDRLMQSAMKGISGGVGGGHPEASGGRILYKYKDVFLKNLA